MLKPYTILYNVDKVTILEPVDNGIVSQEILSNNIYHRIVHIMKLSTQEYYNMRTIQTFQ